MHVISRYNQGGTAAWLNVLIEEQRKLGHEVQLLAGYVQGEEAEDSGFTRLGGIHIANLGKQISIFSDLKALLEVRTQIKRFKPDIVNTHTSKAGMIGRLAAFSLFKNRPTIIHTYHGHILYGYYGKLATKVFTFIEIVLSFMTDLFLVSGKKVERELRAVKVIRKTPTIQARPGIEDTYLNREFKNDSSLVVGWLGRLTKIKRPDRVIQIAKNFPQVKFSIGGEGELKSELINSAPPNVEFLGWVKSSEFWNRCDIALLTSDNEAQPIAVIEAAMHALPIIAENVGSVADVVTDMQNGILVNSDEQRSSALKILLEDENLRIRLGQVARQKAQEEFSIKQFIEAHEQAYEKALELSKSH